MAKVIQEKIKIPISEFILKSKNLSGSIKVDYSSKEGKFKIEVVERKQKKLSIP